MQLTSGGSYLSPIEPYPHKSEVICSEIHSAHSCSVIVATETGDAHAVSAKPCGRTEIDGARDTLAI